MRSICGDLIEGVVKLHLLDCVGVWNADISVAVYERLREMEHWRPSLLDMLRQIELEAQLLW